MKWTRALLMAGALALGGCNPGGVFSVRECTIDSDPKGLTCDSQVIQNPQQSDLPHAHGRELSR